MGVNSLNLPEGFVLDDDPPEGFVLDTKPPQGFVLDSAGANLPSMPMGGPKSTPPPMNQAKVYGMLEGMPSELAEGIKKSAIEYGRGREFGTISMPEVSLPKSLWEGFKNIPDNIKEIIKDTSSAIMYVGKNVGGWSLGLGKDAYEDLNKTFIYQYQLQQDAKTAEIPDYALPARIKNIPSTAKAIKKGVSKMPEDIANWIVDEAGEAKDTGYKRYLYKSIEEHPVDYLLIGNALRALAGQGVKVTLKGVGKVGNRAPKVANTVDNILSTERTPMVYKMPAEVAGEKVTAKTVEFARKYSDDPLSKYVFQKSFDRILNKHPGLEQAFAEHKSAKSLTRLRQAYDKAGVQERIQLHREIDQMLATLDKDELGIAVKYLEGRASLIGEQTEQFKKFEGWYRDKMTRQQAELGLEDVDNVLYGPIAKITGQSVDDIKAELGDFTPAYVKQVHTRFDTKMGDFFTDTTGKRYAMPSLKRRKVNQGYSEDLKVVLPKWASEYVKYKNTQAYIKEFTDTYGIKVNLGSIKHVEGGLQSGDKVYKGYKIVAPDGYLRFYQGKFDAYQAIAKKLDDMDLDEAIATTITERTTGLKETTRILEEGTKAEISRQAQLIEGRVKEALSSRGFAEGEATQMVERIKSGGMEGIKTIVTEKEYTKIREVLKTRGVDPNKIKEAFRGVEKSFVGVTKNVPVYLVPENISKRLESWATPRFGSQRVHNALKIVYDKPVGVWKDSVLATTPRWIKNNVVGDIMFNTMEGVGPISYTRAFSSKYSNVIPDELAKASFAEVMKYNPKLGLAAKGTVGKLMKDMGETKTVKGIAKIKDTGYAVNTAFEQPFVRALYIKEARAKAKQMLKKEGVKASDAAIMYKLETIKNSPSLRKPIIDKLHDTLPVFDLSGSLERKYLKGAMPFYNWYKFMAQYGAKLPAKHPFKTVGARGLGALSENEREVAFMQMFPEMHAEVEQNGIPNRFDNLWPVTAKDEKGDAVFFNARGMNPFLTIEDIMEGDIINMMSPIIKIGLESSTGQSAFTGREFTSGEAGRGKFKEFGKYSPPLLEHVMQQFPQYQLLKEILVPAKQWDSGTLLNPEPKLDHITGKYKYPIKSVDRLLNYMGIDRKTLNVDNAWKQFQQNRQRATDETFKKQQSKYSEYLSPDEMKQLFNYIKSDPETWEKIIERIRNNKKLSAKKKKQLMDELRGE